MKRFLVRVVVMLISFAFGIAIDRLVSQPATDCCEPPEVVVPEPQRELVPTVAPIEPLPTATPKPTFVFDYDRSKFNFFAAFSIMGPTPREFDDISVLEVALSPVDDDAYISVNTCTPGAACDSAPAVFALVTERRLFFVTSQQRISEVEYRFDGKFLRTDFDAVDGKNVAVLRGTLTKTKNGRTIAEHTFKFRFEHLGC